MNFEDNHIQLFNWKRYLYSTLNSYIMKWILRIDNDTKALYITANKRERYRESLLLYNKNTNNRLYYNQQYITPITIPIKTTQQQQQQNTTEKKPPTLILRVIERILNFFTGGKWW